MRSMILVVAAVLVGCIQGPANAQVPTDLDAKAFKARIAKGDARLIDVRTSAEYAAGHIEGAVNMDWTAADYEKTFSSLDPKGTVMVYCAMGGRSEQAKEYLVDRGITVIQLLDGINGWKKAGYPVVKDR